MFNLLKRSDVRQVRQVLSFPSSAWECSPRSSAPQPPSIVSGTHTPRSSPRGHH